MKSKMLISSTANLLDFVIKQYCKGYKVHRCISVITSVITKRGT